MSSKPREIPRIDRSLSELSHSSRNFLISTVFFLFSRNFIIPPGLFSFLAEISYSSRNFLIPPGIFQSPSECSHSFHECSYRVGSLFSFFVHTLPTDRCARDLGSEKKNGSRTRKRREANYSKQAKVSRQAARTYIRGRRVKKEKKKKKKRVRASLRRKG